VIASVRKHPTSLFKDKIHIRDSAFVQFSHGTSPGAPKGNQNAFKHGRYSAKKIAMKREIAALLREMRKTASELIS
jgi:hypothetical protein